MYKVYCNDKLLYNDRLQSLKISNAVLTLEIGKTGLFEFTIYPDHPYFSEIKEMISMVEVHRNDEVIFYGRILNVSDGFYNEKQVSCEGELAFLLDSLIPPHTYGSSFSGYLAYIVNQHNSMVEYDKRFTAGSVTVGDYTPFTVVENLEYVNALDTLNKRMVEKSGGYLSVRHENGTKYLDLLSYHVDYANVVKQDIKLGKNLVDLKRESNTGDVFSCIIPLGAKQEGSEIRIDIKNVNSGLAYIENEEAVAKYGKIYRQVIFENITYSQTLYEVAKDYLAQNYAGTSTIEITAVDLSGLDSSLDSFNIGQWVNVYDTAHFSDNPQTFLISKMQINISNPAETKIVIGKVIKGLTEMIAAESTSNSGSSSSGGSPGGSSGVTEEEEQPYLLESGTTGIWTWKVFSDNTCEFFGKIPITSANVQTALGSWYRGANLYESTTYPYPVEMTEAPAVEMMFQTRNGMGAFVWVYSQDAATARYYLPQCYLIRPTTATGILGNINIIGKGKI